MGWLGKRWQQDLSVATYAGAAKRNHTYPDVFQLVRKDTEYFAQVNVWHRAAHWQGLTPRLVWTWQRTDSNHFAQPPQTPCLCGSWQDILGGRIVFYFKIHFVKIVIIKQIALFIMNVCV